MTLTTFDWKGWQLGFLPVVVLSGFCGDSIVASTPAKFNYYTVLVHQIQFSLKLGFFQFGMGAGRFCSFHRENQARHSGARQHFEHCV